MIVNLYSFLRRDSKNQEQHSVRTAPYFHFDNQSHTVATAITKISPHADFNGRGANGSTGSATAQRRTMSIAKEKPLSYRITLAVLFDFLVRI
jgi:hypothetical protein